MTATGRDHPLLAELLPRDRAEALRRERIVQEVELLIFKGRFAGFKAADVIATYLSLLAANGVRVGRSALYVWRKRYHEWGIVGLIDGRKRTRFKPRSIDN